MFPYLHVLIRQRIAAWNPANHVDTKHPKAKTILRFVGFALLMLMLYAMLVTLEYFMFQTFAQMGQPEMMLALAGIFCTVTVLITSFFHVFSELFFTKDVGFVSALPISSRQLLGAKLTRIWLGEAGIALAVCAPIVVLYGIHQLAGPLYYLKALLMVPLMPLVPLAVVTLLSFVLIRVSALWKRREALTVIMSMAFMGGFMWFQMQLSMSSDEHMATAVMQLVLRQQSVLEMISGIYPPIKWFAAALMQSGAPAWLHAFSFMLLNLAAISLVTLLLGNTYQKLAIRQSESLARINAMGKRGKGRYRAKSPLWALYLREVKEIFVVPVYAMNSLASAVMFPIILIIMLLGGGSQTSEIALLPLLLSIVSPALMVAIFMAAIAFTTSMNMAVSTAVSREGIRHEFFRTMPVAPKTLVLAKLLMGITIDLICALPMAIALGVLLPAFIPHAAIALLGSMLFSTVTTILALMIDIGHPKFGWKTETEAIKQNGFAAISMFGSMIFLVACGFGCYGLTTLGLSISNALLILCGVALLMVILLVLRLLKHSSQKYIRQEIRQ